MFIGNIPKVSANLEPSFGGGKYAGKVPALTQINFRQTFWKFRVVHKFGSHIPLNTFYDDVHV